MDPHHQNQQFRPNFIPSLSREYPHISITKASNSNLQKNKVKREYAEKTLEDNNQSNPGNVQERVKEEAVSQSDSNAKNAGPLPGKKTRGRMKIKMEFIDNKLKRYTTFSKRKTGIMKKVIHTFFIISNLSQLI